MQRYHQGFLPSAFNNTWINNQERRSRDQLTMILRNNDNLYIPFARLTSSIKQPFINLPKTWSSFNVENIKIIRDKNEFKFKLKEYLLNSLSENITCGRLLCPACHLDK